MSDLARNTGLHNLPPEIFESTLTYLDLESINALRLVDRKLAEKCIGPRFLRCIQQPVLEVSPQSLRSLHALARNPTLSKKIHSLTFLATTMEPSELDKNIKSGKYVAQKLNELGNVVSRTKVRFTPEELEKAKSDLRWLNEQQKARDQESPSEMIEILQLALNLFGTLDVIRFDGGVLRGRTERKAPNSKDWKPLWARAAQILSLVLKAMVQSRVSVKSLDIFRDTDKCCIPIDKITDIASNLGPAQLGILGKDLISLKLSISMAIEDSHKDVEEEEDEEEEEEEDEEEEEKAEEGEDPRPVLEDGTPGIASLFLKSAPALRELDLTFRRTAYGEELFHYYDKIVDSIAHETQLPLLERCALSGFAVKGQSLLLFLQKHSGLRSLTLHECHLTTGSWTPIFAHLERSMPRLEDLSLNNLFGRHTQNMKYAQPRRHAPDLGINPQAADDEQKGKGLVVLLPIWDTNPPPQWTRYSRSNGLAVHTRDFTRDDLAKGLVFRPLRRGPGRALGSPELMRWHKSRTQLYAPPIG